MKVPFLDLRSSFAEIQEELEAAALRVLRSGWYVGGEEVELFEIEFAQFAGAKSCVAVANGLDALRLALVAAGIQAGDEVIVPAHTFIATWLAVTQCGAIPVPVDIDPQTFNLCPVALATALTRRTAAVVPVHLYGLPADLDPIRHECAARGIVVIEDAAQAHGAKYKGKRIGTHGAASSWSFYPGKNLGAFGDAGAVTTDDEELAAKLRLLRNYGAPERYVHRLKGCNSRLDPIQAALLREKLKRLDEWNFRRRRIARFYLERLEDIGLTLPVVPSWADPVWHLFCVRHERRDELGRLLREEGVETLIHYPTPPHLQEAYSELDLRRGSFPVSEKVADSVLSLPIGPAMTDSQVETVVAAVTKAAKRL